jgi:hypothetical protein
MEIPMADQRTSNAPSTALYEIIHDGDGWAVVHNGKKLGTLDTRMAAFDDVVSAIRSSIIEGYEINIKLGREPTYPA